MGYSTEETHQLGIIYKQWPPFSAKISYVRGHYLFREGNSFPRGASLGILMRFQGKGGGVAKPTFKQ